MYVGSINDALLELSCELDSCVFRARHQVWFEYDYEFD